MIKLKKYTQWLIHLRKTKLILFTHRNGLKSNKFTIKKIYAKKRFSKIKTINCFLDIISAF